MNFENELAKQLKENLETVWLLSDQLYGDYPEIMEHQGAYWLMKEREIFFKETLRALNQLSFRQTIRQAIQNE